MDEKKRIRAFAFVAACCCIAAVGFLIAAASGGSTVLYITLACANVGCAGAFGLTAVSKSKRIKSGNNSASGNAKQE